MSSPKSPSVKIGEESDEPEENRLHLSLPFRSCSSHLQHTPKSILWYTVLGHTDVVPLSQTYCLLRKDRTMTTCARKGSHHGSRTYSGIDCRRRWRWLIALTFAASAGNCLGAGRAASRCVVGATCTQPQLPYTGSVSRIGAGGGGTRSWGQGH